MVSLGDSGTLAQLYAKLSRDSASNAWPTFQAAWQALPGGVTNDDPFGGASPTRPAGAPRPLDVELAGKVFGVILADIAAGKESTRS